MEEDAFVRDVSGYPAIDELYMAADVLISDYSSAFFDYAILKRPMLCFAYDLEEYVQKPERTKAFSEKYCPNAGAATDHVVATLKNHLFRKVTA